MSHVRLRTLAICAASMVLLVACSKEKASPLDSRDMPAGYAAVNGAFGMRTGGLVHEGNGYRVPVVEFRTGGEYALYSVLTKCDGSFSRSSGTVFASDGTIRGNIGAQSVQTVIGTPLFAPLVDRICRDVKASQFVPDPFRPKDALALLLGPPDGKGEVKWNHDGSENVASGIKLVSLRKSGKFIRGKERWVYILTGSRDPECEARACGGVIGAALFRFDDGKWFLMSYNPVLVVAGRFGVAVEAAGIKDLQAEGKLPLLSVVSSDCHMGECYAATDLLSVVDDRFVKVWEGQTAYDSMGTPPCEESGACSDWESKFTTVPAKGDGLPDLLVTLTGKVWDESSGKLFRLDEKIKYRFDPVGKYNEISRSGRPVEIPLPRMPVPEGVETDDVSSVMQTGEAPKQEQQSGPGASVCKGPDRDAEVRAALPANYPREEVRKGIEGTTVLVVSTDTNGSVTAVEVEKSSGNNNLDREAMKTARRWLFNPGIKDCKYVESRMRVPVEFKL